MSTTRDTLFGLPRYVLAILRHMEAHSERLKWSLAEETNQLTLTLTWNFDSTKPRKTKETLWKKLQRSLGLDRHSTSSPSSHSSQPDLQQTPVTRRFLLETSSPLTDPTSATGAAQTTWDGWRSRDSALTVTSRCRSLPGRMHDSGAASAAVGQGVDSWERSSGSYRQSRGRRTERAEHQATSVPLRTRRAHHHHHQQQQQQRELQRGVYTRYTSSPTYVTPSSHLTLPVHRSRGTVMAAKSSYMTSQHAGGVALRQASPSRFSWPGASFELQTGLGDDEEGRSSGGTQGAAEPTSPSLPSSTSTATNACTRPPALHQPPSDVTATNDDVTPSNGDADTEVADVAAVVSADDEIKGDDARLLRRRSCEFNLLDEDGDYWQVETGRGDDVTDAWAWSTTRSDWADVICVTDDNEVTITTTATSAAASVADAVGTDAGDDNDNIDDDDDDVDVEDVDACDEDVSTHQTTTAINETVMKCIESCDKVLLRHSTAIR